MKQKIFLSTNFSNGLNEAQVSGYFGARVVVVVVEIVEVVVVFVVEVVVVVVSSAAALVAFFPHKSK